MAEHRVLHDRGEGRMLSLHPELQIELFKQLPDRPSLLSTILSCKQLYYSFKAACLGNLLENIRYNEIGCGLYGDALIYSLRLMESDIGEEHLRAYISSLRDILKGGAGKGSWNTFLESLGKDDWLERGKKDFYSETSFCYYNQHRLNYVLGEHQSLAPRNRWWINYRLVRLMAHQICHTRLRQDFGKATLSDSSVIQEQSTKEPPTENELRRTERGIYVMWIMTNVGVLIHRPDFLSKTGYDRKKRVTMHREIRRALVSCFDVWDWRVALSLREYMLARLFNVNRYLLDSKMANRRYKAEGHAEPCMWDDDIPDIFRYCGWNDRIPELIMAAFSPPGASRFFFHEEVISSNGIYKPLSNKYPGACRDSDILYSILKAKAAARESNAGGPLSDIASQNLVNTCISGFSDMAGFFWSIMGSYTPALKPWKDIYTFYPREEYPDRKALPLETLRSIVKPRRKVRYGRRTMAAEDLTAVTAGTCVDKGWAWKGHVDLYRTMWDDWRLEKYCDYHKPERRIPNIGAGR